MEAAPADRLPLGGDWQYEPKWDGTRCLVFRDDDDVQLQSGAGDLVTDRFPDIVSELRRLDARRFVLDGSIVVAESRVLLFVFDLLVTERANSLVERMLIERRARLESFAARHFEGARHVAISPQTSEIERAREWLISLPAAGVVAKDSEAPYLSGLSAKWLAL
jgi:ATP-dependent DNA ligase